MKRTLHTLILFLSAATVIAQGHLADWKQAREFQVVLASITDAFDEGNTEPLRSRAAELDTKARQLAESDFPASFDRNATQLAVRQLLERTSEMLKAASDAKSTDIQLAGKLREIRKLYGQLTSARP